LKFPYKDPKVPQKIPFINPFKSPPKYDSLTNPLKGLFKSISAIDKKYLTPHQTYLIEEAAVREVLFIGYVYCSAKTPVDAKNLTHFRSK